MTTGLNRPNSSGMLGQEPLPLRGPPCWRGLGASPALAEGEQEQEGIGFFFAALDSAADPVRTPADPDVLLAQGCGQFNEHAGPIGTLSFKQLIAIVDRAFRLRRPSLRHGD